MRALTRLAAARWAVWIALTVGCCFVLSPTSTAASHSLSTAAPDRQKPGPVTLRGIAVRVSRTGFTLQTTKHGSYVVTTTRDTSVTLNGKKTDVRETDHVGVHAFARGRRLRAIWVHVYLVGGKPYSIKGVVKAIAPTALTVATGGRTIVIGLTSSTTIRLPHGNGVAGDVRVGDRVSVRVHTIRGVALALHIHVYRRQAPERPVEVSGTIASVVAARIAVRSGPNEYQVTITSQTVIYLGADRVTAASLRVGQSVRVYACCLGAPLVARSIHIKKAPSHRVSVRLRGRLMAITSDHLLLATSTGNVSVGLGGETLYEIGSISSTRSDLRIGDEVSVRGYQVSGGILATRVHVYAASREPRTVSGVVVSVAAGRVTVQSGTKRYDVVAGARVSIILRGHTLPFGSIRVGDRLKATGHVNGTTLSANTIVVRRAAPKTGRVTGTVTSIRGSRLTITDADGIAHQVEIAPRVQPTIGGRPAPRDALFPGVHATARGTMANGMLTATALTLTVTIRSVKGRVRQASARVLKMGSAASVITVDLPPGVRAIDGSRRMAPASLASGVYIRVQGYVEPSKAVRATAIHLLHPSLDLAGTIRIKQPGSTLRTTAGEDYRLVISGTTRISAERTDMHLVAADIPSGSHVHVIGTMRSDGALGTTSVVVRLTSVTIRTRVSSVGTHDLSVDDAGATARVRLHPTTSILQGSQPLTLGDVVAGDDVTVYGYRTGSGSILARKILVHRRLVGIDGIVVSTTADGLVLTTGTGNVQVITSQSTVITGTGGAPAAGLVVHVTGYLRGDGVVLATRLRVGKKTVISD